MSDMQDTCYIRNKEKKQEFFRVFVLAWLPEGQGQDMPGTKNPFVETDSEEESRGKKKNPFVDSDSEEDVGRKMSNLG